MRLNLDNMGNGKLQQKKITDDGPGYAILNGELYTWNDGCLRYVKDGDKIIEIPDDGRGWYHRGKDTSENRKKYGIE